MDKLEQAARQMMDALEMQIHGAGSIIHSKLAWQAGRNALAEQAEQESVASGVMDAIKVVLDDVEECQDHDGWTAMLLSMEAYHTLTTAYEEASAAPQPVKQEPVGWLDECGVFRSAEDWDLSGVEGAIPLHTGLQTSQKPVGVIKLWESETGFQNADYEFYGLPIGTHKLYAAPVRTKDLTDEELDALWHGNTEGGWRGLFRAVIAADRERNRG